MWQEPRLLVKPATLQLYYITAKLQLFALLVATIALRQAMHVRVCISASSSDFQTS